MPGAGAQPLDQPSLLPDLGHDPVRGVGRGRRPDVGDVVDQRGVGLVADGGDHRRAVAAMARTSPSSENGSRSSTEPPPRAITMTSTAGSASSFRSPAITDSAAVGPWTAQLCTTNRTAGQRRRAVTSTSRSAALSRPVISPTTAGANGSGRLRAASKSPSAASSRRIRSIRASSSPRPTARISVARSENEPRAT